MRSGRAKRCGGKNDAVHTLSVLTVYYIYSVTKGYVEPSRDDIPIAVTSLGAGLRFISRRMHERHGNIREELTDISRICGITPATMFHAA